MTRDTRPPAPLPTAAEDAQLRAMVRGYCGLKLDSSRLANCLKRAWPALTELGIDSIPTLLRHMGFTAGPAWRVLIPVLTINETYFQRERYQIDDFVQLAPTLRPSSSELRVFSAACSTGEEPYTLAIRLAEAGVRARVLGADIDHQVLAVAEEAKYGASSFRGVDPAWRDRHFDVDGNGWRVKPEYRMMVSFRRVNLLMAEPILQAERFDAIFCRNALIYFDREVQLDVLRQLRALLVPGGYLFLGHSEIFIDVDLGMETVTTSRSTMYRRGVDT